MRNRFEVREAPAGGRPGRYAIWDHKRNAVLRTAASFGTRQEAEAARDTVAVQRQDTWGTVAFRESRPTPKRPLRTCDVARHGDILRHDGQGVTLLDSNQDLVTIPAADIITVVAGATVFGRRRRGTRGAAAIEWVTAYDQVHGWTLEHHVQLRRAVGGESVAVWFAEFMESCSLGRRHVDYDSLVRRTGGRLAPMIANGTAAWLLDQWNLEHPAV